MTSAGAAPLYRTPALRALLGVGLVLIVATCRDGMEPQVQLAPIAVAPVLPSEATLAQFGLTIDHVRFIVVRSRARAESPDTLADTTVFLAPDLTVLDLDLRVPLIAAAETLQVSVVVLAGTLPLFQGSVPVVVTSRRPTTPTEIPVLTYVGPGALVDSIAISPTDPLLFFSDSLRLQVEAFQAGVPITQFYVSWTTSDTSVARVNGLGVLRGPTSRSSVNVIARTPGGAADTVTARFQPLPTQLILVGGGGQTGTAGLPLSLPLEVEVRGGDNLPVGGVAVRFRSVLGLGGVADSIVLTDAAGRARTTATLGVLLGAQTFEASIPGVAVSPVVFSVLALAGLPSQILAVAGDGLLGVVGAALQILPSVLIRDASGNPVAGVPVTFTVGSGGGFVTGASPVTDANGVATVAGWTLGTLAGTNTLTATAGGLTRTFTATGVAGAATQLLATVPILQSAVVGTVVAIAPAVRVLDQFGNPVAGALVTFAPGIGGLVSGGTQLTNAAGLATVGGWTLGTLAAPHTLTATVSGVTPVTFTATGLAGAATQILQLAGNGQLAIVNTILPIDAAVKVLDQFNNPVSGVPVLFAPALGGGSVTGGSAVTDAAGVAQVVSWQLGTLVGPNTLTATAGGLSPVLFTASGTHDVAAQLLHASVVTQTTSAGQAVGVPPAVRVTDQFGNGVPGVPVTFSLTGGLLGFLLPGGGPSTIATTDASGVARVGSWILEGILGGLNTMDATVPGLAGSPRTFNATGILTLATSIAIDDGDGQTGVAGAPLPVLYRVRVMNVIVPVSGAPVNWTVDAAGGSMNPPTSMTDANGFATSTRTLGPGTGAQTVTASVAGFSTTFTATAVPGAPAQIDNVSTDLQSATVGTAVAAAPAVIVKDASNNPLAGVAVAFTVLSGGGSVTGGNATTDPQGIASVGSWTLGTVVGGNSLRATAGGLPPITFGATGLAGQPEHLAFVLEPIRGLAGDTMAPVQVAIQDQYSNHVFTAQDFVTLGLLPGSNPAAKLEPPGVGAAAINGVATFSDFAIDAAGVGNRLQAMAGALTPAPSKPFDVGGVIDSVQDDRLNPVAAAFSQATRLVYVPGVNNTISVFDPSKRQITPFTILQNQPFGVAVNGQANRVYVTTFAPLLGAVMVLDDRDPPAIIAAPLLLAGEAKGIAVDEATNRVFVAVGGDPLKLIPPTLAIIDGTQNIVINSIPFPDGAEAGLGVAFDPIDRLVYVAIPNLGVGVFDPETREHVATIHIVGERGAAETYGLAVDAGKRVLYTTNRADKSVSIINIVNRADLHEVDRVAVGDSPEGLSVDPVRGIVYVANSGSGTVSFIALNDTTSRFTVFATLAVGPQPKAAAVDPSSGSVYVPTTDDRVRVIRP